MINAQITVPTERVAPAALLLLPAPTPTPAPTPEQLKRWCFTSVGKTWV